MTTILVLRDAAEWLDFVEWIGMHETLADIRELPESGCDR